MHTPGPWKHWQPASWAHNEERTWSVQGPPSDFMFLKNEDDARLVAAAPCLLAALGDLLGVIAADELIPESVSFMRAARAAIAKATGATSGG